MIQEYSMPYRAKIIAKAIGKLVKNKKVLDIGCGNGIVSRELERITHCKITGTDILSYLVKKIPFKKMPNKSKLPFKNKEFDFGMFNDVLHHTSKENQIKLIKEALRCCKKVLIFEVAPDFYGKFIDFTINKLHYHKVKVPLTHRTPEDWKKLFDENKIKSKFHDIKKPFFFYPFKNFLIELN